VPRAVCAAIYVGGDEQRLRRCSFGGVKIPLS
jgi:hypothetical protein